MMRTRSTAVKNKYLKGVLLFNLLLFAFTTRSFGQILTNVQAAFNKYAQNNLCEKVFVHTDKSLYLAGEIVWFKIYNVDGETNNPLNLSKVAYANLLDKNNVVVSQLKIAVKNGYGNGSFYLPASVNTGNYKLCVYTSWMKNFGAESYFQKVISIVNPLKSPERAKTVSTATYDLQFFPEGGYVLNDVSNKLGFRMVNADGTGATFSGVIVNEHNDTVALIKPLKFGIGSLVFTPHKGHTYQAIIRVNGEVIKQELPLAINQGYAMQVTDKGDGEIHVGVNSTLSNSGTVYLLVNTRQQIRVALGGTLVNGHADLVISKAKLGDGVSRITLFNSTAQPVCERLMFKRPQQQLSVAVTSDKPLYQARKKVDVEVLAKDQNSKPLAANMSLAVYRNDSLQTNTAADIQSYLWLTSELKGNIEEPSYYFNNKTAEADEALDNLLLTQGWRRFKWADVLNDDRPAFKYIPEYGGHIIWAKVTDPQTKLPVKNIAACLSTPGKRVQFYTATSDTLGYLAFNTKSFYGNNELVIQAVNTVDSLLKIELLDPFSDRFASGSLPDLHLNKNVKNTLQQYSIGVQTQNIYQGDKIRSFYNPPVDSTAFFGLADKVYLLDDYTRFTTMEEVLREYVHETLVGRSKGKFHFRTLTPDDGVMENNPLVLLDGIPVFDMDKIIALDPLKIKRLDVVDKHFNVRPLSEDGILSFSSYKSDLAGYEIDPHALVVDYEGLQLKRDYFSPVYDAPEQANNHLPDLRNVLYWQPNVVTGADGKYRLSFYTSDLTGKYTGVIQGLTGNGQAGSGTFTFEVKK